MAFDYNSIQLHVSELIKHHETSEVEFKSAKGGFPKSFWDTYSAFANTHGGTIILGVKETKGLFTLNGLTDDEIDKLIKEFWSGAHNKSTINICLLNDSDVEVAQIDGKKVILFHVPQAQRDQRPVHRTLNAFNGTYRRNYEGDYQCGIAEVRRMYADADVNRPADGRILKNYSWDDIDMPSFEQYRRLFSLAKPGHPWLSLGNDELMKKLGGYRKDRETGEEGFTLAGLLMFGKYDSIKEETCAPRYFPDYKEIPNDTSKTRWLDRVYPDGTWESNLFQFYRRVLPKLQEVIPTPFKLEGSLRRDDTPAHEALREAFANLCVHADYSEESSLLVYRYPHKIVFSNPGVMLISRQQYFRGGESVCRNTSLQQMFMMIGSAEKAGSGVDKILKGWETLNWKKPYPVEKAQPNKVELVMPLESLLDEAVLSELKQIFGSKMNNMDQEEIMVLSMALTEEIINNERLRDVFSLHPTDITHLLQKLCKEGFLISTGYGRGTVYRLNDTSSDGETLQVEAKNLTSTNLSDPQANVLYVTLSEGNETDLEDKTLQVKDTNLTSSEGETLQVQDANLTSSIPSRMSRAQLQEMILEFCTEWRSAEEIAEHVHRHKQYIRGEILPKMDHLLIRKFPTIEKHPGQKYKTKD